MDHRDQNLALEVSLSHSGHTLSRPGFISLLSINQTTRALLKTTYLNRSPYKDYLRISLTGLESDNDEEMFSSLGALNFTFIAYFSAEENPQLKYYLETYVSCIDISSLESCSTFNFLHSDNKRKTILFLNEEIGQQYSNITDLRESLEEKRSKRNSNEALQLAFMWYYGQGGGRDRNSARATFEQLIEDNALLSPEDKANALYLLACMQYDGDGGGHDHDSARATFGQLIEDHAPLSDQVKARINDYLEDLSRRVL